MLFNSLGDAITGVVSRLQSGLVRVNRPGRRATSLVTAAALAIGSTLMLTAAPAQAVNASGTIVGKVTWPANIGDFANVGVWALDAQGVGASPAGSPTPSTQILLRNVANTADYGPANLAVSASPTHPGIYVTSGLTLHDEDTASAAALSRYTSAAGGGASFTQTRNVDWAAKGSSNIVTVEIPMPSGFDGETCGMEVNPTTFELVIMNDCEPGTRTGYWVLNPGPDQDPTTIADNTFRTIRAATASAVDGGTVSDMTLDAAGNIYNLSSNGTTGNIIRTDHLTGVTSIAGSFVPAATVGTYSADGVGLAFYKGKIINVTGTRGTNSLGINPLNLTAAAVTGTDFVNLPTSFDPYLDGAGTSGAIALEGTVTNAAGGAGLLGQTVAVYSSNGDGTATLAGYRTTAADGSFNFLLDSDSTLYYARVVQPTLTTSGQVKNGEVTAVSTSFSAGGSLTASTISSENASKNNGINPALGTVGTTKITIADTNDLAKYDVKDARAVANADFAVSFAGSTADRNSNAALTTTAATGYGPQHLSVTDLYRLGGTNGSHLIGATDNSHSSDDGVQLSLGGTNSALNNQKFISGLGYTVVADSQGTDASNAVISAWAGTNTTTAWAGLGTITSATGSGSKSLTFTPSTAGTATMRFNTSNAAIASATNANGDYAGTSGTAGTKAWTTAGEVEDYAGTILANTASLTRFQQTNITGTPTYTYSGAGTTAGSTTITDSGFAAAIQGTSGTFTVTASNIPSGLTLAKVLQINTITGATTATLTPTGNAVTASIAAGTDTVLRFVYRATASASTSTISATPTSTTAGSSSTVTVTLNDASGNPIGVGGDTVAIATILGSVGSVTDNGDGTYTATLSSSATGTANLTFKVNGTDSTATTSVSFNAGAVSAANSAVVIDNATAVSVDTGSHTITVTVKDANNNLVGGQAGNLSAAGATVGSFTEGSTGVYTATVTSTTSGTKNVTVSHTVAGALSPVVAANFAAGAISKANSSVAIDNATAVSVDSGSHTITVTLKDANGNPVPGVASSLSGAGTDVAVGAFTETGTGSYTASATSTVSSGHVVTVSHNTLGALAPTVTANFAAGAVSLANSSFTVGAASAIANGSATVPVTATLKDAHNNPVTGADAAKLAGSATNSATVSAFTSNGDGTFSGTVTSSIAGAKTVAVTYDGSTVPTGANATATFTAGAVSLANSGYTVAAASVVAGSTPGVLVTVTLKDASNNPVSGSASKLTSSASPSTGVSVPASWTDNGDGTYTGYVTSTKSGAKAITVSFDGTALSYDVRTSTFVAGPISLANSSFTVGATSVVAGSAPGVPVTVTLRDANNNVVTDADAAKLAGTATNSASLSSFTSNGDGTYSSQVTSTVAGTKTVSVTFDGGTVPTGANNTATFKPGSASVAASTIVASPTTQTAGGNSTITVTLKDANGNQLTSGGATVAIDSSLGSVGSVTDHNDGTYTATLTSTTAGPATVSFSINGTESTNTASVTFNAGAVDLTDKAHSNYTVGAVAIPADGASTVNISVKLADQYGNKISLSDLTKLTAASAPSAGVTFGAFTETSTGTYTATVKSTSVGAKAITVSYNGSAVSLATSGNATATFLKVPVDINASSFEVSAASVVADNAQTATITVVLTNTGGSAASGWASDLAASSAPNTDVTVSSFTESTTTPGTYTATVKSQVAGAKVISLTQVSTGSTLTATGGKNVATFIAGDPSAANSQASIDNSTPIVADGSASHLITIQLADANANPVTGKAGSVSLAAANNADAKVSFGAITESGTPGTYTVAVRSTEAGSQSITVNFAGSSSTIEIGSVAANFAAGAPDLGVTGKSWVEGTAGTKTANGTAYHTVTATILDGYGNPITNRDVVFTLESGLSVEGGGSATATTDATGVAQLTVVSTTAGTYDVVGKVDGELTVLRGSPVTVTFVAGSASMTTTTLTASAGDVAADGVASHAVTVTVRDANGNPVAGQSVTFQLAPELYKAGNSTWVPNEAVTTDANGVATLNVVSMSPMSYPVTATVGGSQVTKPTSPVMVSFIAGQADASKSSWTISPGTSQAVGSTFTATVTLHDSSGNPVGADQQATFTVPAGVSASATSCTTTAYSNGTCSITMTSNTAGTYSIKAAVGSDQIGGLVPITFAAGAADLGETGTSTLGVDTAVAVVADGAASHTLTVKVADAYGNPISTNVVFDLPAGLSAVGSNTVATNGAGVATLKVVSTSAGAYLVNAYVGSVNPANLINNGSPARANFTSGAPSVANSGFVVNQAGPLMVGASSTYTGTITVKDVNNNPVANASVVLRASLADTSPVNGTTDASGIFTGSFTSNVAGSTTFTGYVLIGGVETKVSSADRTWTAGTPVSGGTSAVSGTTGTRTANGTDAHAVTTYVADIFGNPVPGASVAIVLPAGASLASGTAATTTGADGKATWNVVSSAMGTYSVTATVVTTNGVETITAGSPVSLKYIAGAADSANSALTLIPDVTAPVANGSDSYTATATVKDATGNLIEGAQVTFSVASGASLSALTAYTNASGVASVKVTSVKAGTFAVNAKVGGTDVTGSPVNADFVAGTPDLSDNTNSHYTVSSATVVADGASTATITVALADAHGNAVAGADTSKFAVTSSPSAGVTVPTSWTDLGTGAYTASVTSTVAGKKTIAVTFDAASVLLATSGNKIAWFVAGAPSTATSTITATGPVQANGSATSEVTVKLVDTQGNPVTTAHSVLVSTTVGSVSAQATANGDGTYTAHLVSNTVGDATVSFTIDGATATHTATVSFVPKLAAPSVNPSNGSSVTGTTVPSTTVKVYGPDGTTVICSTTSDASGNFSCAPLNPQPTDGQQITVVAADSNGFDGSATAVTIDAAAPAKPVISAPTNNSAISDSTPTISGTGEIGATVTITDASNAVVCSATVAADKSWSCTPSTALTDGTYTLKATQTDLAGNTSAASSPVTVTVDTVNPAKPAISSPTSGAAINDSTPTVSGTGEAGATVTVKDSSGNTVCTTTVAAGGAWSCTTSTLADGAQTLTVTQADAAGNTSAPSDPVSLTVDTGIPAKPVVSSPAAGSVINDSTPTISGNGESGATVTVKDTSGATVCTAIADASGNWSCTPSTAFTDGPQSLTVTQADAAGNVSEATTLNVTLDSVTPATPSVNASNGSSVSGTAEAGSTVTVKDASGTTLCTATAAADGSWSCVPSPTPADHAVLTVTSTDAGGNTSPSASVTVDSSAPAAPVVNPTNGSTVSGTAEAGTTVTIAYTGTDGSAHTKTVVVNPDGTWNATLSPAAEDATAVVVTASDRSGNVSPSTTVYADSTAPSKPVINPTSGSSVSGTAEPGSSVEITYTDASGDTHTVTVTTGTNGTWTTALVPGAGDGTTLSATATDAAGNASGSTDITVDASAPASPTVAPSDGQTVRISGVEAGATPTLVDASGHPIAGTWVDNGTGSWTFTPTTALTESDVVSVVLTDGSGNKSDPVKVLIDTTAPAAPVIDPSNGASVSGSAEPGSMVTITYTGTDGATHSVTTPVDASGNWALALSPAAADGTPISATATDAAGNVSPRTTVYADSSAPSAPVVSPSNGSVVSGTAEPDSTLTITYTGTDGTTHTTTVTVGADGTWAKPLSPAAANATTVTVTATDAAGNTSQPGAVVVDSVAPDSPVVYPTKGGVVTGTAEPDSTVTISYTGIDGATHTATTTANPDGTWSATLSPTAANGTTVTATSSDISGNTSAPTSVTADSQAPLAPVVNPSNGSSASGTAEPGSTVTLTYQGTDGSSHTVTVIADGSGNWSLNLSPAAADASTINATATDASGNVSGQGSATVDSSAPNAPVINPSNGHTVAGTAEAGSTVTITYTGTDGKTHTATATTGLDGTWSATLSPIAADNSPIQARATDAVGNTSGPATVVADSAAPAAPVVVGPTKGAPVSGTAEAGSTVTITYTGTDGATHVATTIAQPDGSWSVALVPAPQNGTNISVTATDAVGNDSAASTVKADTSAPAAPVVNPTNGTSVTGSAEPGSTVTITYTGTDGATHTASVPVGSGGAWAATLSPAAKDGTALDVTAADAAGNISAPTRVIADSTPPSAPLVNPTNGSTVTGAAEPGSTVTITYIDVNGNPKTTQVTAGKDGSWSTTLSPSAKDASTVTVTAADAAGNVSTPSTTVVDAKAPAAPVTSPSNGGAVSGTAEPGSTVTITYTDGDGHKHTDAVVVGADGTWTISLQPGAANGSPISAIATDVLGNTSAPSVIKVAGIWMDLKWDTNVPGQAQVAYGHNFLPGEVVTGVAHSTPLQLGTQVADAQGDVTFTFTVPTNFELGTNNHRVMLTGATSGSVYHLFGLHSDVTGSLAYTGVAVGVPVGLGLLALVGGWFLVMAAKRRKNEEAQV
jgi:large repetitive protein